MGNGVSRRTLRRQQKKILIEEAQEDIDSVESYLYNNRHRLDVNTITGLDKLLSLLYFHCQELINSEV